MRANGDDLLHFLLGLALGLGQKPLDVLLVQVGRENTQGRQAQLPLRKVLEHLRKPPRDVRDLGTIPHRALTQTKMDHAVLEETLIATALTIPQVRASGYSTRFTHSTDSKSK